MMVEVVGFQIKLEVKVLQTDGQTEPIKSNPVWKKILIFKATLKVKV